MIIRYSLLLLLACMGTALAQESEMSLNMTLFGHLNPVDSTGAHAALWGYTAPDGREYALFASQIGTHIIDITEKPIRQVAYIWGPRNGWREMKVYGEYAYIVSESRDVGGGLQIVDLSNLPASATLVRTDSSHFKSAHTIYIRDHFMYVMGTQAEAGANGGAVILDLEPDPLNPRRVGTVNPYYYHDAWVRNDTLLGAAINGQGCDIYDISSKENPKHLATITYPFSGTHNAEITSDGGYVVTSDEVNFTPKTMKVWDIRDLNNITKVAEYTPSTMDIVHNVHVKGRYVVAAWYTAGVRIIDMIDPRHPREVGFYDTYPTPSGGYNGVWEVYPFFASGKIIASDRQTGLYVVEFNGATAGSVSGVVRNKTTGDPIPGVSIAIPELDTVIRSDESGRYYAGGANGREWTLRTRHFGYEGTSEGFTLEGDREHDILLPPLELVSGIIRARDRAGNPIDDFVYAVEPHIHSSSSSDGAGTVLLPRDSVFTVTVGRWGYGIERVPIRVTQANQEVVVTLRKYYEDNATLDLGWSYQSTEDNATTGRWTRLVPYLGYPGSGWIHPEAEPSKDPNGYVFITGAPPLNLPPQNGDVNMGRTTFTSPVMNLMEYTAPTLEFDLWFVHYKNRDVLDSFLVQLSNDDGATWTTIHAEAETRGGWAHHSIPLTERLPATDRMRVRFRASDTLGDAIVYAALDNIEVRGGGEPAEVIPDMYDENAGHSLMVAPNPMIASGIVVIHAYREYERLRIELFDLLGERVRLLYEGGLETGEDYSFDLGEDLPAGSYLIRTTDERGNIRVARFVMMK